MTMSPDVIRNIRNSVSDKGMKKKIEHVEKFFTHLPKKTESYSFLPKIKKPTIKNNFRLYLSQT
jgi:hypothetical protein